MKIVIYIFCYNEAIIIKQTIEHYKLNFPESKIIIYDNYSTDDSCKIAEDLGCEIIKWDTDNKTNEHKLTDLKNTIWKNSTYDWTIVCDMDEWLCITEKELLDEIQIGTTILRVKGCNIFGDSKSAILDDINLHELRKGLYFPMENKNICFNNTVITDMNYLFGGHKCSPIGKIIPSKKEYILKHMDMLGLPYKIWKNKLRYERSCEMRQKYNLDTHYFSNDTQTINKYNNDFKAIHDISELMSSAALNK